MKQFADCVKTGNCYLKHTTCLGQNYTEIYYRKKSQFRIVIPIVVIDCFEYSSTRYSCCCPFLAPSGLLFSFILSCFVLFFGSFYCSLICFIWLINIIKSLFSTSSSQQVTFHLNSHHRLCSLLTFSFPCLVFHCQALRNLYSSPSLIVHQISLYLDSW